MEIFREKESEEKVCVKLSCVVEKNAQQNLKQIITPKNPEPILKKMIKQEIPKKVKIVEEKIISIPVVKDKLSQKNEIVEEEVKQEIIQKNNIEVPSYSEVQIEDENARVKRVEKEYLEENIQEIVKLLSDNLYYPRSARKRRITGEVVVKFKLSIQAKAISIEIVTSKNDILSRAAIKTIENLSGKFPKPKEDLVLEVPIKYNLKNII